MAYMLNSWPKQEPLTTRKICLLQGATRFTTWLDAMHQCYFVKVLKATVHDVAFDSVAKNALVVLAVEDIEDEVF